MPTIPVPCTNCLRFHYGVCREAPKQCFKCGGFNHIKRYCPYGRRVPTSQRGPLPGSRPWCEMNGINNDPELKRKILDALKSSPGCSIWVNERCIHAGNERHFTQSESFERGRGRPLAEKVIWNRSRSPPRGARAQSPRQNARYRSRTPIRRGSPYQYPRQEQQRPRTYASGSNAVLVEARRHAKREESTADLNVRIITAAHPLPPKPAQASGQAPLGEISANIPRLTLPSFEKPAAHSMPSIANTAVLRSQTWVQNEPQVDDPYFVVGVTEGATEDEIIDAYQQAIYEIDLERMADGVPTGPGAPPSIFDESIKLLNAAKRQLLGY